jgi:hypothetical protein
MGPVQARDQGSPGPTGCGRGVTAAGAAVGGWAGRSGPVDGSGSAAAAGTGGGAMGGWVGRGGTAMDPGRTGTLTARAPGDPDGFGTALVRAGSAPPATADGSARRCRAGDLSRPCLPGRLGCSATAPPVVLSRAVTFSAALPCSWAALSWAAAFSAPVPVSPSARLAGEGSVVSASMFGLDSYVSPDREIPLPPPIARDQGDSGPLRSTGHKRQKHGAPKKPENSVPDSQLSTPNQPYPQINVNSGRARRTRATLTAPTHRAALKGGAAALPAAQRSRPPDAGSHRLCRRRTPGGRR